MKTHIIFILLLMLAARGYAQHDGHLMHQPADTASKEPGKSEYHATAMDQMSSALSLSLPMNRNGSGTSWLPDASPMYGYMTHSGKWMFMFHGDIFVRYNRQDITSAGMRGGEKWDAPSMVMGMAQRKVGRRGLLRFNAMLSADALIAGGSGYPLLFQTGETWQGKPLIDRQHPHDLFSELSVSYAYMLSPKADVYIYAGYPGEPAIGPTVFMHRTSGMFMPDAPISHHWVDATHITFGVATLGFRYGRFKVEGSSFTGREPGESRYDFDRPLFNSWSGRLSYNPSVRWALQVSRAYITDPEVAHPGEDVQRTTASATYVHPISDARYFTTTALWGQNATGGHYVYNAALAEAMLKWNKLAVYGRYEWAQKPGGELGFYPSLFSAHRVYSVNALTVGATYDLWRMGPVIAAVGGQISISHAAGTESAYGSYPLGGEVYLHFYPTLMK